LKRKRTAAFVCIVPLIIVGGIACRPQAASKIDYAVEGVPLTQVDITDEFWAPKQEVNRTVSILHCFKQHEENGRIGDDRLIEGAAYMLAKKRDPQFEAYIDGKIDRTIESLADRIKDPDSSVRVGGTFLEAAVAYFNATGKRKMLDAAIKYADMMDSAYGPGKKTYISTHEGLKIGLIRLFRQTGDERYWKLAKFFLDERGKDSTPREERYAQDRIFAQDYKPVVDQKEAVGHCVRATYLYIPLTDIAALTGEPAYAQADDLIWDDMISKKVFVTGGIGSIRFHEQFGSAYELPNLSCWCETCAAYGNAVWNHRLFLLHRDAKYVDALERILYNGLLVGVSLKGDRFFYQNSMISYGTYDRYKWINVPCCPPNVVRMVASVGGYIYAQTADEIYVNLFVGSKSNVKLAKTDVGITQETRYPWEGKVKMTLNPERPAKFGLYVRIPEWARNQPLPSDLYRYVDTTAEKPILKVNGKIIERELDKGYIRIERKWRAGDVVELDLPMPVHKVLAHESVQDDKGRIALERGPLVYCAEWPDNRGSALNLVVSDDASFAPEYRKELLNGVVAVTGKISKIERGADGVTVETKPHDLVAIPYYAWANRGKGEMAVWMARAADKARLEPVLPKPISRVAQFGGIEKSWTGYNDQNDSIGAVYDGAEPLNSADESNLYYRLRPPQGKPAWIEYEFQVPTKVSSTEIYWVHDRRFAIPPSSWRILYKDGRAWKPVKNLDPYGIEKDKFNRVTFEPVTTKNVRIEVEPEPVPWKAGQYGPPWAMPLDKDIVWREAGVIEWRVK